MMTSGRIEELVGAEGDVDLVVRVGGRRRRVSVSADGTVRVWDAVADHYSIHHDLTPRQVARIRRLADDEREDGVVEDER